jgi:hypothetical protein
MCGLASGRFDFKATADMDAEVRVFVQDLDVPLPPVSSRLKERLGQILDALKGVRARNGQCSVNAFNGILHRSFRSATRRETLGMHSKGGCRGGELKILCIIAELGIMFRCYSGPLLRRDRNGSLFATRTDPEKPLLALQSFWRRPRGNFSSWNEIFSFRVRTMH